MDVAALLKMSAAEKQRIKELAENDTIYMAREILGYTTSEVIRYDESKRQYFAEVKTGEEWGLSYLGPHKEMAALLDGPDLFKHMEAPRLSYKTTLIIAWCIRLMCKDPNVRIFYAMATAGEAKKTSDTLRWILESNEILIALWGQFKPKGKKGWNQSGFVIAQRTDQTLRDPTFQIGALDMERTGVHCTVLIGDDLVTPETVKTPLGIAAVESYWKTISTYFPVAGAMILENGTRHSDADLHGIFLVEPLASLYAKVVLGCGMEPYLDEQGMAHLRGEPIWAHLTKDFLTMKLMSLNMDIHDFSRQFCNMCLPAGIAKFRREQIQCCRWMPWMGQLAGYMLVDLATTAKDEACFSVILVVALDNVRRAYLLDAWIGKQPLSFVADRLIQIHREWSEDLSIHGTTIEKGQLKNAFEPILEEKLRASQSRIRIIEVSRGAGQPGKEQRINALAGRFQTGRMWFVVDKIHQTYEDRGSRPLFNPRGYRSSPGVPALPDGEIVMQLIRYPSYPFQDVPDALADIDAMDDGRYLLAGAGKSKMGAADGQGRPEAGQFYRPSIWHGGQSLADGDERNDGADDHWSRIAKQGEA